MILVVDLVPLFEVMLQIYLRVGTIFLGGGVHFVFFSNNISE